MSSSPEAGIARWTIRTGRRWGAALLACCAMTGCLDAPQDQGGGGSAIGAWTLEATAGCRQQLTLGADGRFALASWLESGTRSSIRQIVGDVSSAGAMHGDFGATFAPDIALPSSALAYCADWGQNAQTALPFAAVDTALGITALDLTYHPSVSADLGVVLAGADAARRERVVLYINPEHVLTAIQADADYPGGIFRALGGDPFPEAAAFPGRDLIRLPEAIFKTEHLGMTTGQSLDKVILVLSAGVDVTFSSFPGAPGDTCTYVLYEDTGFTTPVNPPPLDELASSQTLAINPADSGWPFATEVVSGTTAYLVPVETRAPADGDCGVLIRANPIADRVAREHAAAPASAALFRAGISSGTNLIAGSRGRFPHHLEYFPLTGGGIPLEPITLSESIITTAITSSAADAATPFDPLRLKGATRTPTRLTVDGALSVYASSAARFGWGPFSPGEEPPGTPLAVPSSAPVTAATDGARATFRLTMASAQRIAIWTDGGIATQGTLMDAAGTLVTASAGGSDDDAGFRMEVDLAAGTYALAVQAAQGAYTVHTEVLSGPGDFADAGLQQCMVEAGWAHVGTLRAAWCAGHDIRALDGIDAANELEFLDLSQNGIDDVTVLANLLLLHTLSLALNPVTDLAPLAGLSLLRQLSLAGTPVTPAALSALAPLASHLALLDLTGATAIPTEELADLRTLFPGTTIITPAGTVLP